MESLSSSIVTLSRSTPIREDCWSEEATATLIEAWGTRYVDLNRGNLRQKDWQDVADVVNARHGHTKKTYRSDVQCKNRIDTIKKRYKAEKSKVGSSGTINSSWPFFDRLDELIGSSFVIKKQTSLSPSPSASPPLGVPLTKASCSIPVVAEIAMPQKRSSDDGYFRRNYSAVAAAAAAAEWESEEEKCLDDEEDRGGGMRVLARAIERFGEVYERVESEKVRQMVELEKQRMKFTRDLEMERMRVFTETQIQLEKIKKCKRSSCSNGERDF